MRPRRRPASFHPAQSDELVITAEKAAQILVDNKLYSPTAEVVELTSQALIENATESCGKSERLFRKPVDVHPSTPVGRRGTRPETRIQKGLREATTIQGRQYSIHAVERMQERGYTPSVIEEAIKNGVQLPDPDIRNLRHYDAINNVGVVTDTASGLVVTIRDGAFT